MTKPDSRFRQSINRWRMDTRQGLWIRGKRLVRLIITQNEKNVLRTCRYERMRKNPEKQKKSSAKHSASLTLKASSAIKT
jgi:hypothetical protein